MQEGFHIFHVFLDAFLFDTVYFVLERDEVQ